MVRIETATGEGGILHTYDPFKTPGCHYPERKVQVFLPDLPASTALYPVLYMNDGHTVFSKGGLANQSWDLASTLDRLIVQGLMEKMIVVAVFPVNRNRTLQESELIAMLRSTLQSRGRPCIYMDWGLIRQGGLHNRLIEERATARGREMAGLLQRVFGYRIGQDLLFYEDPEGEHQEISWGKRIPRALEWFQRSRGDRL